FFSSRRRHTRWPRDWSSDVCSSDLGKKLKDAEDAPEEVEEPVATEDARQMAATVRQLYVQEGHARLMKALGAPPDSFALRPLLRSEERRVGKEWRSGGWR